MNDILSVTVADGKYTIIFDAGYNLKSLRYGEPFREHNGDGLMLALTQEVDSLRKKLEKYESNDPVVGK